MAQSVRAFAFSADPQLNPESEFDIRIEPIRGLWEGLQVQVTVVRCIAGGQEFSRFACVLHQGVVRTLGTSLGGYGLMSGLVHGESFYFTSP